MVRAVKRGGRLLGEVVLSLSLGTVKIQLDMALSGLLFIPDPSGVGLDGLQSCLQPQPL